MPDKRSYIHYHFVPKKQLQHQSNYPRITNVQSTLLGLITWVTDIPSTSQVQYGKNPLLGPLSSFDGSLLTSHSVQLTGLSTSTIYYFRVQSFYLDALSISDLYSFLTIGAILAEDGSYILAEDGSKILVE